MRHASVPKKDRRRTRKHWAVECRQCAYTAPAREEGGCPFCGSWDQVEVGMLSAQEMYDRNYLPEVQR